MLERVRPAMLQFHGEETPVFCAQFGVPYIKACRVRPGVDLLEYLRPFSGAAGWLLDSHVEEYGGVGESFDWSLVPAERSRPLILSGGLDARTMWGRRSGACVPGRWTCPAASNPPRASRMRRRSPLSSPRSEMQMYDLPDPRGHFGPYGGVFVAETLSHALDELRDAYERCRKRSGVHGRVPLRAQALRRPAEPGLPRQALVGAAAAARRSTSSART